MEQNILGNLVSDGNISSLSLSPVFISHLSETLSGIPCRTLHARNVSPLSIPSCFYQSPLRNSAWDTFPKLCMRTDSNVPPPHPFMILLVTFSKLCLGYLAKLCMRTDSNVSPLPIPSCFYQSPSETLPGIPCRTLHAHRQ